MTQPGYFPTYSGIQTAFRAPLDYNPRNSIAIIGAPFDMATSNRSGARLGPSAIREMSLTFDADRDLQYPGSQPILNGVVDAGDVMINIGDPHRSIEDRLTQLIDGGNTLVVLGGDHSITLDSLRAHYKKWGPIALLHFDAHPDTWKDTYPTHGSFVTTAVKEGLIVPDYSLQVGLRTVAPDNFGIHQVYAYDFHLAHQAMAKFVARAGSMPVYLTFDIDVFDPAFAPGTGTPVSGGLTPREVYPLLNLLKPIEIKGMDVVEVCPPYDCSGITALAAATVIQHVLQL